MKNYNRQIISITNRKWDKYSNETNVKYIKRKLQEYDINIPKYLQQGKLTGKQIESNINKIVKKANKLRNEDLPTLGLPTIAVSIPWDKTEPSL